MTRIVVHGHPRPHRFDQDTFLEALGRHLPDAVTVDVRPPLLERAARDPKTTGLDAHAARIARTRVLDPFRPPHPRVVCSTIEHDREKAILRGETSPTGRPPPEGELYDAAELQAYAADRIPAEERRLDIVHLVLTDRLFGTWQRSDGRYHARVVLAGTPTLLSTSGLVEAPARPRGYYAAAAQGAQGIGPGTAVLESALSDEMLVHGDARIPRFLAGPALAAYCWQVHGEAFCRDPECMLFNAHWQKDLVHAQSHGRPCAHHVRLLARFP